MNDLQASYPGVEGQLQTDAVTVFVRGWETPLTANYLVAGNDLYITCALVIEEEPTTPMTW